MASTSLPSQRVPIPGLTLISMEQFDEEMALRNAVEEEAENRKRKENIALGDLPTPSRKTQKRSMTTHLSTEPILLPSKTRAEWVPRLNHLIQVHGHRSDFTFAEELAQSFSCVLRLSTGDAEMQRFDTGDQVFKSKREAKDKVAQQGVEYLSSLPILPKTRLPSVAAASDQLVDRSENWIGLLTNFAQASALPALVCRGYQGGTGALFSACCTIALATGELEVGDASNFWSSKKAAKTMAAKEAVLRLREMGRLPGAASSHSSASNQHSSSEADTSNGSGAEPRGTSFSASVLALCSQLGIAQPQYQASQPEAAGFYSYHAVFPGEPELRGKIALVERVYGRKKAKEECDKRLVARLEEIKAQRVAMLENFTAAR